MRGGTYCRRPIEGTAKEYGKKGRKEGDKGTNGIIERYKNDEENVAA
jgi:hypothetical protein